LNRKPIVSVVVPAYERTEPIRKLIQCLFEQDLPPEDYEIIIVDGSLTDNNQQMVAGLLPGARCALRYFRKDPEGPGPARNLGARQAKGDYIAFLDSDCYATPHWLRSGLRAFSEEVGIVQGRTLPDPSVPMGVLNYSLRVEQETFTYETANVFYRRVAFEQSGGFPVDLTPTRAKPTGGEDVVVAWAVKRRGWKSCFAHDALVYHEVFPLAIWNWIFIRHLFVWPDLVRKFPELRRFMFWSYFLDRTQGLFVLGLVGTVMAPVFHLAWLLLWLPYSITRASEPSSTLHGILRPLRVLAYGSRDACTLLILALASIRYRCLLL
jgi:glycosyltransferase involved in cell wall biosynthesis